MALQPYFHASNLLPDSDQSQWGLSGYNPFVFDAGHGVVKRSIGMPQKIFQPQSFAE